MTKTQTELAMRRMLDRMDAVVVDMGWADVDAALALSAGDDACADASTAESVRLLRRYLRMKKCVVRIATWGQK